MEGIVPGPRGEAFVIVLTVKLQSLDVLQNDLLKLLRPKPILDIESARVVILNALNDLIVLYLELL